VPMRTMAECELAADELATTTNMVGTVRVACRHRPMVEGIAPHNHFLPGTRYAFCALVAFTKMATKMSEARTSEKQESGAAPDQRATKGVSRFGCG